MRDFPLPNKAIKKTQKFAPQFLQNFEGYKGWRFFLIASEDFMRSSISYLVDETILDIFKEKETTVEYKGKAN